MSPAPPPGIPANQRRAIATLASLLGWDRPGEPRPIEQSVLNANYRVDTAAGPSFIVRALLCAVAHP
jgi:hypothetical protein